ncbi:MAG: DUF721 domain-containing protein [Flavobacteriales bacterium]|nr:DUF721 domain-containing protein [Flavobacteriales bacterium]MCZ2444255.1 DUF721 domain-containing protein [Flavobacteriales bacterium]
MAASDEYNMKQALELYLASLKMDDKLMELRIKEAWYLQMGNAIAKRTTSLTYKNHVLNIRLNSAVLRNELTGQLSLIQSLLNERLGAEIIKEIYFK